MSEICRHYSANFFRSGLPFIVFVDFNSASGISFEAKYVPIISTSKPLSEPRTLVPQNDFPQFSLQKNRLVACNHWRIRNQNDLSDMRLSSAAQARD